MLTWFVLVPFYLHSEFVSSTWGLLFFCLEFRCYWQYFFWTLCTIYMIIRTRWSVSMCLIIIIFLSNFRYFVLVHSAWGNRRHENLPLCLLYSATFYEWNLYLCMYSSWVFFFFFVKKSFANLSVHLLFHEMFNVPDT